MRSVAVVSGVVVLVSLITPHALAQKKKPPKKPTSTAPAKPKPAAPKPAPAPAPSASAAPSASTAPAPAPLPPHTTKKPTHPAPPEEPEPEEKPPERKAPVPFAPLFETGLGLHVFQRHLRYSGDQFNVLPPYDLNGAPAGSLIASVYPYRTRNFGLGLAGSFEYAFALGSTFKEPPPGQTASSYTTRALQYSIGPRAAYYFDRGSSVSLSVDYVGQIYSLDLPPPTMTQPGVPDVAYGSIRPSLTGRLGLSPQIALFAEAGYLFVLTAGEIISDTYFAKARSTVNGFEVGAGGAFQFSPQFGIRLAVDFRRYNLHFNPLASDPYIASGATDDYLGAWIGATYRM